MNTATYDSIVNRQEVDALKEMIFKRARERAQSFTDDVQAGYTTLVQNDIMDLARDSFVETKNPFTKIKEEQQPVAQDKVKQETNHQEIGFAKRQVDEVKAQVYSTNKKFNTLIANTEVEATMQEARVALEQKTSFVGALDFLNSQASIVLVKNRGKAFEAMA